MNGLVFFTKVLPGRNVQGELGVTKVGEKTDLVGAPPQQRAKLTEHDEQGEDCHGNFKEDNECSKRRHYTMSLVLWTHYRKP